MNAQLKQLLYDKCITATAAMAEMNMNRNKFYECESDPRIDKFIESHQDDWTFSPETFLAALDKAGLPQLQFANQYGIHFVTVNLYCKCKQRPSRTTGDYEVIKRFCDLWK